MWEFNFFAHAVVYSYHGLRNALLYKMQMAWRKRFGVVYIMGANLCLHCLCEWS